VCRSSEVLLFGNGKKQRQQWVTQDGHIRHDLQANGRYVEARGTREKAYQGRYVVTGTHIDYCDDTGFTDGILHHAGMVLYRQP
jgi:hypothetical protein